MREESNLVEGCKRGNTKVTVFYCQLKEIGSPGPSIVPSRSTEGVRSKEDPRMSTRVVRQRVPILRRRNSQIEISSVFVERNRKELEKTVVSHKGILFTKTVFRVRIFINMRP